MTESSAPRLHEHRAAGTRARIVLGVLLLIGIVAFAVDNRDDVRIGWVVGDGNAPLALVLLLTAAVGAVMGWLLLHRPHHHE